MADGFHPVQDYHKLPSLPTAVTLRAYEVYKAVFGEQRAMIEGGCRGGFSLGEIIALLYAYPFPRAEWSRRVDEALRRPPHSAVGGQEPK